MLAKIWNYKKWIKVTDKQWLVEHFDKIIRDAGFNVLAEVDHDFQPQGYTKLYLLGESHFAIHTFPEEDKTYIELSSCNKRMHKQCIRLIKKIGL